MRIIRTARLRLVPVTSANAAALWEVLQGPDLRDYQDLPDVNRAQFRAHRRRRGPRAWDRAAPAGSNGWCITLAGTKPSAGSRCASPRAIASPQRSAIASCTPIAAAALPPRPSARWWKKAFGTRVCARSAPSVFPRIGPSRAVLRNWVSPTKACSSAAQPSKAKPSTLSCTRWNTRAGRNRLRRIRRPLNSDPGLVESGVTLR